MIPLTECPDDTCDQVAEVVDTFLLESTSGPVRHIKTHCVLGHIFTVPL